MPALHELPDDVMVGRLQRGAFDYFSRYTDAENGLVADAIRMAAPAYMND
jgi:hypothetical protein